MTSIHSGHRQRVRDRYKANGLDGFSAHEVLELLLFYARARGDVNPLAHELLNTFGSLHGVLEASPEQLQQVKGVGEETAVLLSVVVPLFRRYQKSRMGEQVVLDRYRRTEEYCLSLLAGLRMEKFCVVLVNGSRQVLGVRTIAEGSLNEVQAYPRKVVEAAINHNAYGVILCHNHPGGTAAPSTDDLQSTRAIAAALRTVGVELMDHVIVAGMEAYSLMARGYLTDM